MIRQRALEKLIVATGLVIDEARRMRRSLTDNEISLWKAYDDFLAARDEKCPSCDDEKIAHGYVHTHCGQCGRPFKPTMVKPTAEKEKKHCHHKFTQNGKCISCGEWVGLGDMESGTGGKKPIEPLPDISHYTTERGVIKQDKFNDVVHDKINEIIKRMEDKWK